MSSFCWFSALGLVVSLWCQLPARFFDVTHFARNPEVWMRLKWLLDSPPARWGLLDFMLVTFSSLLLSSPVLLVFFSPPSPQPRPSMHSVLYSRPVFPAGPQPRVSTPSVPDRMSDGMPKYIQIECQMEWQTKSQRENARKNARSNLRKRMPERMPDQTSEIECQKECQNICQIKCQIECQNIMIMSDNRMPE